LREQRHDAAHRKLGFRSQRRVVVVRDRVRDDGERITAQPVYTRDDLSTALEAIGDDCNGGYAEALRFDGVVQTARRAAASVSDSGD
jgi:hypothetical protein